MPTGLFVPQSRCPSCVWPIRPSTAQRIIELAQQADAQHAALVLFPELSISAYTNDDLFQQDALLDRSLQAIAKVVEASRSLSPVLLIGAPLRFEEKLFNCAFVIYRGRILGVVPKSYIPNYREFYEKRHFVAARHAIQSEVVVLGQRAPFGADLIFDAVNVPDFAFHVEICEDVWTPIPPSTYAALAGATVLTNLSASNITVGKADYRRSLCAGQSARCVAAYLYSGVGPGESTTDLAWDGHALIYENGNRLAESERFSRDQQLILADIDLERLRQDRMRMNSYADAVLDHSERIQQMRAVTFQLRLPVQEIPLQRRVERFPYVPSDPAVLDERCYEVYNIQVHGLMKRLASDRH